MAKSKLIFVEGMTGAGKSTTAGNIETWLSARGDRVRRYHEMDDDNPIRTKGVDAMRANHPHVKRLPGLGEDGFAADPSVYRVDQWGALARRSVDDGVTVVLESRYLQNSVQPRYMAGAPARKVHEGFEEIHAQVAPAHPLLVYLRPEDIRAHLRRTIDARDPGWGQWLAKTFDRNGWSRSRSLTGEDAVIGFYEDWEILAGELFERHAGPKLWLSDPHQDWDGALAKVYALLGD